MTPGHATGRARFMRPVAIPVFLALLAAGLPAAADTLLVANKSDATVDLFDAASGDKVATLETGDGPHEIAVSPDGRTAVVADYGGGEAGRTLTVIDIPGARVVRTIDLGRHERPHGLAFLDAKSLAVTTEGSRSLIVVDPHEGAVLHAVGTGQDVSHMVALAPDRSRAFVANIGSGTMTAIDLGTKAKIGDVETGAEAEGIAVSPDGREVWVSNRRAGTLTIVDAKSLDVRAELEAPGFPIRVAFTPDGRHVLVTAPQNGEVLIFDAKKRTRREVVRIAEGRVAESGDRLFGDAFGDSPVPIGVLVSPDGSRAYVACSNADAVVVLDLPSGRVKNVLRGGRQPDGMGYSTADVEARD